MSIPTYDQFISPLFVLLGEHPEGLSTRDAYVILADRLGLTNEEREHYLPSGRQRTFHNRIGWANDRLKRGGLSMSPRRGVWALSAAGRERFDRAPGGLSPTEVTTLYDLARETGAGAEAVVVAEEAATRSPEERIDAAIAELHRSVADEILTLIGEASPIFFERLVLDVLHAMGYGVSRESLQATSGSWDGGIDGIISLDKLGLDKVYVQAKRWQGTVGRPHVQAFYGALAGQRATKGVMITTSDFSSGAVDYANSVSGSLVLVNGRLLARLMIENGVGVAVARTVRIVSIDSDYFVE